MAVTTSLPRARRHGFTLVELLVAIIILAIVSMIVWRGLDSLLGTRARLQPEGEDVKALLVAFGQMERDSANVAPSGLFALTAKPVSVRDTVDGQVLQLVRIAPSAAGESARLQQVFYRVSEGTLLRQATPAAATVTAALETLDADTLSTARLLSAVKSLQVRVWREGSGWVDSGWVNPSSSEPVAAPAAPTPGGGPVPPWQTTPGLEIRIERTDGQVFRRVLLVG